MLYFLLILVALFPQSYIGLAWHLWLPSFGECGRGKCVGGQDGDGCIEVTNIDQWVSGEKKQSATSGSQLVLNTYSGWKLKVTLLRKPS